MEETTSDEPPSYIFQMSDLRQHHLLKDIDCTIDLEKADLPTCPPAQPTSLAGKFKRFFASERASTGLWLLLFITVLVLSDFISGEAFCHNSFLEALIVLMPVTFGVIMAQNFLRGPDPKDFHIRKYPAAETLVMLIVAIAFESALLKVKGRRCVVGTAGAGCEAAVGVQEVVVKKVVEMVVIVCGPCPENVQ